MREHADIKHLRDLSPQQWKSGVAAWLGWLFDGLDMHIYTLVWTVFVAQLLGLAEDNPEVGTKGSLIQLKGEMESIDAGRNVGAGH